MGILGLFWICLVFSATSISADVIDDQVTDAENWLRSSESREVTEADEPCNASPYLSYLHSHLKSLFMENYRKSTSVRSKISAADVTSNLRFQPLIYSFYLKNVLQPYRSRLSEASAPSTSFCYLDKRLEINCYEEYEDDDEKNAHCRVERDIAVCVPNSDSTSEGVCVRCNRLDYVIREGSLKDEDSIRHLEDTCYPLSRRGPKSVPEWTRPGGLMNTTEDARWLRWFLESSFVFEAKKVGDECNASPGLSKGRSYVELLMKKHFGKMNSSGAASLTIPGMETKEEEAAYEAVRAELSGKQRDFISGKLFGIHFSESEYYTEVKKHFNEVYCWREGGLVCVEGKCRICGGEEEVKANSTDLREACRPEGLEVGGGGGDGRLSSGGMMLILGILCSTSELIRQLHSEFVKTVIHLF
jgi:hypothetical protein